MGPLQNFPDQVDGRDLGVFQALERLWRPAQIAKNAGKGPQVITYDATRVTGKSRVSCRAFQILWGPRGEKEKYFCQFCKLISLEYEMDCQ
jgi:hypothetical protein